jgi:XTP/dITP diphosphohydrolase
MQKLLIASRNQGKIKGIKHIFSDLPYTLLSPEDIDLDPEFDPEETGTTYKANALLKAKAYAQKTNLSTIADDSGLEVDALDGRPGVYSKRYGKDDSERKKRLLDDLKDVPEKERAARFVCAICVYDPSTKKTIHTEGRVEGKIAFEEKGSKGFGYDPVFIPNEGSGQTFAQSSIQFKNMVSHRARAVIKAKKLLPDIIRP